MVDLSISSQDVALYDSAGVELGTATNPLKSLVTVGNQVGSWGYDAGVAGTVSYAGGKRILQITAIALEAAGSIIINSGASIVIPYGSTDKASSSLTIVPKGNLSNPTIVFTNTDSFFVEYIT